MNVSMKLKNKRLIIGGVILILLALGSLVFIQIRSSYTSKTNATQAVTTSVVHLGDMTVEISGTGVIVAPNAVDLAFSTYGKVAELNANPGKSVREGEILAKLDRITSLQMDVDTKQLELTKAQKALDDLETNKEVKLANALIAQSDAAAALETAEKGQLTKYSPRCAREVTEQYYYDYMYAKHDFNYWNNAYVDGGTGYGWMYILERRAPYQQSMNLGYANWKYCEGYSELEIEQSKAGVEASEAAYQKAKKYYETLKDTGGLDPEELALAQTTTKNAELQFNEAQRILNGATLISPMDGTVITVAAAVGETINAESKATNATTYKSPFIKIADLSRPVLKASFDESDLAGLNTNCAVIATFASLPDKNYEGTITQINPTLVTNDSVTTAQAYISLKDTQSSERMNLPVGLGATVDLTCNIAKNAILVPLQALKEETVGKARVYVLTSEGKTEARSVDVGAKSATYAEVKGNINPGEVVITSSIK